MNATERGRSSEDHRLLLEMVHNIQRGAPATLSLCRIVKERKLKKVAGLVLVCAPALALGVILETIWLLAPALAGAAWIVSSLLNPKVVYFSPWGAIVQLSRGPSGTYLLLPTDCITDSALCLPEMHAEELRRETWEVLASDDETCLDRLEEPGLTLCLPGDEERFVVAPPGKRHVALKELVASSAGRILVVAFPEADRTFVGGALAIAAGLDWSDSSRRTLQGIESCPDVAVGTMPCGTSGRSGPPRRQGQWRESIVVIRVAVSFVAQTLLAWLVASGSAVLLGGVAGVVGWVLIYLLTLVTSQNAPGFDDYVLFVAFLAALSLPLSILLLVDSLRAFVFAEYDLRRDAKQLDAVLSRELPRLRNSLGDICRHIELSLGASFRVSSVVLLPDAGTVPSVHAIGGRELCLSVPSYLVREFPPNRLCALIAHEIAHFVSSSGVVYRFVQRCDLAADRLRTSSGSGWYDDVSRMISNLPPLMKGLLLQSFQTVGKIHVFLTLRSFSRLRRIASSSMFEAEFAADQGAASVVGEDVIARALLHATSLRVGGDPDLYYEILGRRDSLTHPCLRTRIERLGASTTVVEEFAPSCYDPDLSELAELAKKLASGQVETTARVAGTQQGEMESEKLKIATSPRQER